MLSWTGRMQFWHPGRKFFAQSPKKCVIYYYFSEFVLPKMFFRTRRMQIWQACLKFFPSKSEKTLKIEIFRQKIHLPKVFIKTTCWLKMFVWTRRNDFWEHHPSGQFVFAQSPNKSLKVQIFFGKKVAENTVLEINLENTSFRSKLELLEPM